MKQLSKPVRSMPVTNTTTNKDIRAWQNKNRQEDKEAKQKLKKNSERKGFFGRLMS